MKAVKGEELFVSTENKVGQLCAVSKLIKDSDVNIRAISAYAVANKAFFRLVTSDNTKAAQGLKSIGKVEAREVVIVEMSDKVGQLYSLAAKLKDANIDLAYIYGSTVKAGQQANIIFSSNNNNKALEVISS
ncbi:MAG: hypothetical protein JSV34_05330 [Candidatus Omnitrophota bacterium]|nr:MAG: hypothetical protein JSV34_05330 [Candidatus Omnitrophota bacterium]